MFGLPTMGYEPCLSSKDNSHPCMADPEKVLLNATGFSQILKDGNQTSMKRYIERLLQHNGTVVTDAVELESFVQAFFGPVMFGNHALGVHGLKQNERLFNNLLETLSSHAALTGMMRSGNESCVADRDSDEATIGHAIGMACRHIPNFDCDDVPMECRSDLWTVADFVFGAYHAQMHRAGTRFALQSCYFEGAARLMTTVQQLASSKPVCVVQSNWRPPSRRLSTGLHQIPEDKDVYDNSEGMLLAMVLASSTALLAIVLCVRLLMPRSEKTRRGSSSIHPTAIEELTSVEVIQLPSSSSSSLVSIDEGI